MARSIRQYGWSILGGERPMTDKWWRSVVPDRDGPSPVLDTSVAHPARVYDYWLGGKDNFAADREVG
jgi:S-adenosyl methyltransferase